MAGPAKRAPEGAQALARRAMTENLVTQEETMLNAPTIEQLHALKLAAMATAWTEQQQEADMTALAFDERLRAPKSGHRWRRHTSSGVSPAFARSTPRTHWRSRTQGRFAEARDYLTRTLEIF